MAEREQGEQGPERASARRPRAEVAHIFPFWDIGGRGYFGYRMALAAKLFDREVQRIVAEDGGLSLPQWRVLAQLGLKGDATVRLLADGAAVDRAEASRSVRDLETAGLVERRDNPLDSRSPLFSLTDAGQARFETTRKPVSRFIANLVAGVDADDLDAADRVLWTITQGCLTED